MQQWNFYQWLRPCPHVGGYLVKRAHLYAFGPIVHTWTEISAPKTDAFENSGQSVDLFSGSPDLRLRVCVWTLVAGVFGLKLHTRRQNTTSYYATQFLTLASIINGGVGICSVWILSPLPAVDSWLFLPTDTASHHRTYGLKQGKGNLCLYSAVPPRKPSPRRVMCDVM